MEHESKEHTLYPGLWIHVYAPHPPIPVEEELFVCGRS